MATYIIMGVSGCGKSTIGLMLADRLALPFLEGDDFHSVANREKMSSGTPLTNDDRQGWITALARAANKNDESVVACSALNEQVRGWLTDEITGTCQFIYLKGDREVIRQRLEARNRHFFSAEMLDSQFAALEVPLAVPAISVDQSPEEVCMEIMRRL